MAFTLCYLGLCRVLGLLRSSRRTETDKDIESWCSATRCVSSSATSMCASPIALWIGRSSPPSRGCWRDGAGAPSSPRQRRSFAGTESSRGANGGAGDPLVALVGRHVRRARRAHRPDRLREPALGLCRIFGDPRTWPGVGHDCQCSRECGCHLGAGRSNYQRWWRGDDLAVCGRSGRATSPQSDG